MPDSPNHPALARLRSRRRRETPYERWDRVSRPFIVLAALVPLIVVFDGGVGVRSALTVEVLDFVFWGVFLVDFVVRLRLRPGYLHTWWGRVDLVVVVGTFPWYVLFGPSSQLLSLLRLARLARIVAAVAAMPGFRRLVTQLNKVVIYFIAIWLGCSYLVYQAESGAAGFDSYGDAVWWGIVTVATVGYGDLVPSTDLARWIAGVLIISGVALFGTVAGSLASVFGTGADEDDDDDDAGEAPVDEGAAGEPATDAIGLLVEEVRQLRNEVTELRAALDRPPPEG